MRVIITLLLSIIFCSCNKSKSNNIDSYQESIEVYDTQMAEVQLPEPSELTKSDSVVLLKSWRNIMEALSNNNVELLKTYSFDIINCQACNSFPKGTFIDKIPSRQISNENFLKFYRDSLFFKQVLQYYSNDCEIDMFQMNKKRPVEYTYSKADTIRFYIVRFWNSHLPRHKQSHNFYFIKTEKAFRLFGLYL